MLVSWEPGHTGVNHTVLFYTFDHTLLQEVGTSTSAIVDNLENKVSYLVLVIIVSGDSYGVTATFHDFHFEAGKLLRSMFVYTLYSQDFISKNLHTSMTMSSKSEAKHWIM